MEAVEVDRHRRAIEREFVEAIEDNRIGLAQEIIKANPDLNLIDRFLAGEIK